MSITAQSLKPAPQILPPVTGEVTTLSGNQAPANISSPVADKTVETPGDASFKADIRKALEKYFQSPTPLPLQGVEVSNIPSDSSYGKLIGAQRDIIDSPAFKQWRKDNQLDDVYSLTIDINTGTITGKTFGNNPTTKTVDLHTFVGGDLLLSTTKALTPEGGRFTLRGGGDFLESTATALPNIARFYGTEFSSLKEYFDDGRATQQAAAKLFHSQLGNEPLTPANATDPFREDMSRLKLQIADMEYRFQLSKHLESILQRNDFPSENYIRTELNSYSILFNEESSFALKDDPNYNKRINLVTVLQGYGMSIPKSYAELEALIKALQTPQLTAPAHGNLTGAISQLDNNDQRKLYETTKGALLPLEESSLLVQLTRDIPLDEKAFKENPRLAIAAMLKSPFAQKLADLAEEQLGKLASPEAINDWVLAALHTVLDKESVNTNPPTSTSNKIAGFDLANVDHIGKENSTLRKELSEHLISIGRATPENVDLVMYILLSRKAPHLLVKDVPPFVVKGSHAQVSFTTAVARLEAQAPGSTSNMTYAEVMKRADLPPVNVTDQAIEQQAQNNALKEWGVLNGLLVANDQDNYPPSQIDQVRASFNKQISDLSAASTAFSNEVPDLQKRALAAIKSWNPHLTEEQILRKSLDAVNSEFLEFPGPYSLVDVFLQKTDNITTYTKGDFTSRDADIDLDKIDLQGAASVQYKNNFNSDVKAYLNDHEAASKTQVKFLLSGLSLEDQRIIQNGKVSVSKLVKVSKSNYGDQNTEYVSPNSVFVRSEVKDKDGVRTYTYEINGADNTVKRRDDLNPITPGPLPTSFRAGFGGTYLESVTPDGDYPADLLDQNPSGVSEGVPKSYFSERSQYIADAMVKSVDVQRYEEQLRGQTTFDTEVPFHQKVVDFLKGLVPGYNAIENFIEGKWQEGLVDLAWDAFGFLLGGATAGVKVGTSAAKTFLSGGKKLVRGVLGAINPLDPKGLALVAVQEIVKAIQNSAVTGTFNNLKIDVVKTFSNIPNATVGKAVIDGKTQEVGAVNLGGDWYALDPVTRKPYGLPLKEFTTS